jgi:hypothetical protein
MAATTKVIPNMNMQMPDTINPVRMFLRARRRFIIAAENTV